MTSVMNAFKTCLRLLAVIVAKPGRQPWASFGRLAGMIAMSCLLIQSANAEDGPEGADLAKYDDVPALQLLNNIMEPTRPGVAEPGVLTAEWTDAVVKELESSQETRRSFQNMAVKGPLANLAWFTGVEKLEKQRALWPLVACLGHQSPDVQIKTLESLIRLKDKRSLPVLLAYAKSIDFVVAGSENATIHGLAQRTVAIALSDIAGLSLSFKQGSELESLESAIAAYERSK